MASTSTIQIIDDDDEFDWEAAVQAIDVACESTKNPGSKKEKRPINSRQSTLDKFIGIGGVPKPQEVTNQNAGDSNHYTVEVDEKGSCIKIDAEAAKTWIYPENVPHRDYQFAITQTSLFSNTLVALPTGLGKTLIAAVVMYNYFRWFPEGKIVFAAPSRPLVMQQIEACHNIVGIPQEWTIDLTGQTSPNKRESFWRAKRVFFVTPQVLEKDIQSGSCFAKQIVCLVIDEAHRALGNYSYCVAVRELMAVDVQLRILALTATPGSKQLTIQQIIDNLQISTLEYRNESDHDVLPYVHDRKIELIEVAMGQDAVEINNLLSEVIRPFVARLCTLGVLQKRDFQTLSPCDLLNSRDRFRQSPPENLPQMKYGEIEGYFGVLITLYHIRKLLSGHGIRPAFEMLEDKLKQGPFARLMSKNEVLWKTKILMQQSLSRGDPSPKLSKMLEVLIDHFKTKDPQKSKVIIFSNFRGSVRDIMDALANVGEFVKATEFVGQSAGKTLKGQSQKVQQAVLEKFRAGGFNVIVATSIGEEGLDIMEVDLVICFDANVSPLRMIQRMGRTGRKHEGRVVVLACEGSELKGYMRKQANSKAIKKHMRNGGITSFNFHSSPRMIPHIFKPEVQYVKLSIEQYVPRGKKVLDDHNVQTPDFEAKLTNAETDILRKYFQPTTANLWRPSLIAFPHFQAFPSRVHKIMHSLRSVMLIDTMQRMQELSYSRGQKAAFIEDKGYSDLSSSVETVEHLESSTKDLQTFHDSLEVNSKGEVPESHSSPMDACRTEKQCLPEFQPQNPSVHSYLFGSDFVSVDDLGKVLVMSVPLLPLKEVFRSKFTSASSADLLNCSKQDAFHFGPSLAEYKEEPIHVKCVKSTGTRCEGDEDMLNKFSDSGTQQELNQVGDERVLPTPISKSKFSEGETNKAPQVVEKKTPLVLADDSCNDFSEVELSPRLTNLLKNGVIPESPTDGTGISESKSQSEFRVRDLDSPSKLQTELILNSSVLIKNGMVIKDSDASGRDVLASSVKNEIQKSLVNGKHSSTRSYAAFPVVEEIGNPSPSSCSKDWHFSSGGKSESIKQERKFKRLRKYGDLHKRPSKEKEESRGALVELARSSICSSLVAHKHARGEKKIFEAARVFIEEQAEVSGEVPVSEDDEDEQDNNSYDDSFIDDRINPTAGSTQAEASRSDMMTVYRRSLLSQSPLERLPNSFTGCSPDSVIHMTQTNESASSAGTTKHSLQTPQTGLDADSTGLNSACSQLNPKKNPESMPHESNCTQREDESNNGRRKRKLSFYQANTLPIQDLEQEFFVQSEAAGKALPLHDQIGKSEPIRDDFDDDQFYEGIDLDAIEEQATKYLKYKSEQPVQNQMMIPKPQNPAVLDSPTFDLGF